MSSEKPEEKSRRRDHVEAQTLSISESEFWQWFRPVLAENWMRGVVGEYWVMKALGMTDEIRKGWNTWDIETPDGILIEVKTSGYWQSWQKPGDKMATPRFGAPRVRVEADESMGLQQGHYRPAHLHVFCLHKQKDVTKLDPLDTSQWDFYVVPTTILDANLNPNAKSPSISLRFLSDRRLNPVSFDALSDAILKAAKTGQQA